MTNVLILTVDDMDGRTPGCVGGVPETVTPRIDELAASGATFPNAHVPIAVCQPSRSALFTGRYPHRNGAEGFGPIRDDIPTLCDLLRPAGYRLGIIGKVVHIAPVERMGWDLAVDRDELVEGRSPARYAEETRRFLADARERGQPWFLMANAHDPHRPFHASDQEQTMFGPEVAAGIPLPSRVYRPDEVEVPPWLPDLPDVRLEIAEYVSSCRRADDVIGAVLDEADSAGDTDDTIVVFLSDNGMAFPFAKANCYLQSTRTPLLVRWPGVAEAGTVVPHLVSTLDVFATIAAATGVDAGQGYDSTDLRPMLRGVAPPTERVHTVFHETILQVRYEMRCHQDHRWGYIWNAWSDGEHAYRAENMTGRTWAAMVEASADRADVRARADFYTHRVPEELYDLQSDPHGLVNLVADKRFASVLAAARTTMATWMGTVDDPLASRFGAEVLTR